MARLLRNASSLRGSLYLDTLESRRGLFETSTLLRHFSAAKGRKKLKADDSGEESMSSKELALSIAIDQIQAAFGKGSIMWLGRSQSHMQISVISTGSFALDMALGIGGFPKGRVVEIYGPEASGKTTLALHVIAEAQKNGEYCAFVDAEHALDPHMAEAIGVKTENLLLAQPDCGEQALSLVDTLIRSGSVGVVVVDSVAALVPKGELDGEMGDAHMAMQARLMSQALRKISHSLSLSQTILIFTNQIRAKLGGFSYGPAETTCGGNALKFYASVRLNVRRIGSVKKGDEIIGNNVNVKIVKNKHAPPFREAQFELLFGKGICREGELIDHALKHKFMTKNGSYIRFGEVNKFRDSLKNYLVENESIKDELEQKLRGLLLSNESRDNESTDCESEITDDQSVAED